MCDDAVAKGLVLFLFVPSRKGERDKRGRKQKILRHSLTHIVQLVVESAGVTNRLPVLIASPERGLGRLAVGAGGAFPSRGALLEKWKRQEKIKPS